MAQSEPDLESDRPFQIRFWHFQRFAWIVLALVLLAALAGLTGKGGPLSRASVSGPQGEVTYPRVSRWQLGDEMVVSLPPGTGQSVAIEIGGGFSKIFQLERIQPAPKESYATPDGQLLVFDLAGPSGRRDISFFLRPGQPTLSSAIWVRIGDGAPLVLTPTILP